MKPHWRWGITLDLRHCGRLARLALCVLMATMLPSMSGAAEIAIKNKATYPELFLEGAIEPGDAKKLLDVIKADPVWFVALRGINVNSPGGSVREAIDLAKIVESSGMTLRVDQGKTCASACFILFASANYRWAANNAKVLVHRPYSTSMPGNSVEFAEQMEAQQKTILAMRDYLQSRSIRSSLIDKMMALPSNAAHEVTVAEVYEEFGSMSPTLEELTLRKCELTNRNIFRRGSDGERDITCIDEVLFPIKNDWLKNLIGAKTFEVAKHDALYIRANKLGYVNPDLCSSALRKHDAALHARDWRSLEEHAKQVIEDCSIMDLGETLADRMYASIARARRGLGKSQDALETASLCTRLYANSPSCHVEMATILVDLHRASDARHAIDSAEGVLSRVIDNARRELANAESEEKRRSLEAAVGLFEEYRLDLKDLRQDLAR